MSTDPNREALRLIRGEPALFAMELLWRWSFGLGLLALFLYVYACVRPALILSEADTLALSGHDPFAISETVSRLAADVLPLLVRALAEICAPAAMLWIAANSLGRGIVIRGIMRRLTSESAGENAAPIAAFIATNATRWSAFALLAASRVLMLLILVIGYLGGGLLATLVDPLGQRIALAAATVLISLALAAWLWSYIDRVLSLAPILLVRDGLRPLDAIGAAIGFLTRNRSRLRAIARQNGAIRGASALVITILGIFTALLPAPTLVIGILLALETVAYLLISDLLLLARLAAYIQVAIDELTLLRPALEDRSGTPVP
jgi:hypothetical protein